MVTVLEVDQWTSTGNITDIPWKSWVNNPGKCFKSLHGGDSEAIKIIYGGNYRIKKVPNNSSPSIGNVWFIEGEEGFPKKWKANYDSSG